MRPLAIPSPYAGLSYIGLLCICLLCICLLAPSATAQTHWSLQRPAAPPIPAIEKADWPRDDLDRFVLARLEAHQLQPAAPSDRSTIIRRVSLDLTGLPPSPDEVRAFVADRSPNAYQKVVDRLLASPRYGERMASDWLDLARYADTYGYQNDVDRRVWPWRDWVIASFNQNLPFDQFATWQLAGDLLPQATREQRLATAFNRLHRQTNEGGSVDEEFRVEYVADRVHTFGMAFLGMTMECARCHDHKFDPISQRDYYALSAYFDDIDESGLYSHFTRGVPTPAMLLSSDKEEQQLQQLEGQIKALEQAVDHPGDVKLLGHYDFETLDKRVLQNRAEPPTGVKAKHGRIHESPQLSEGKHDKALLFSGENNATFPGVGEFRRWDPFSFTMWIRVSAHKDRAVIMHRSKAWTDAASCGYQLLLEDGKPSFSLIHFWPGDAIRVRTTEAIPAQTWVHIGVTYDGSSRARGLKIYVDGQTANVEVVRDHLTKDIVSGGGLVLTLAQRFRDRGFINGSIDEPQVFAGTLQPEDLLAICAGEELSARPVDTATGKQHQALRKLRQQHGTLVDKTPSIMTMAATAKPRQAYVLARGSYLERREPIQADVPAGIGHLGLGVPKDRLALARWLTDPANPLTARVAINRLWQIAFGRGLVATAEDFGVQGSRPSHRKLLDYLALEYVRSGWDTKAMLRRMVLSSTYRQSSKTSEKRRENDPEAILLSRYPSRRLSSEAIRDTALFASGLLVEKLGGPSVKPYQPPGLWKEKSGRVYKHDQDTGRYRRSLYTYWKRTSPPPSMMIFDAGKREVCIARRQTTNTPLQALVMMNDPQFVEASRILAERVTHLHESTEAQVRSLFAYLTSRSPYQRELDAMLALHQDQLEDYNRNPKAALALLSVGDRACDKTLHQAKLAALSIVASAILSFDNTVMQR